MNHLGTLKLETKRLVLRRFEKEDLEQIFQNCWSDFEVWKWTLYKPMHNIKDVINIAEMFTDKWFGAYERPNRYSWAIQHKDSGEVIGRLFGMHPDDDLSQIELTYEIGKFWWNKGLMTEVVDEVIKFFFTLVGLNRIYSCHASDNPASGKVMQKCGMTYEGTMRQACKCNCGIFDKVNYAILAEKYFKTKKC